MCGETQHLHLWKYIYIYIDLLKLPGRVLGNKWIVQIVSYKLNKATVIGCWYINTKISPAAILQSHKCNIYLCTATQTHLCPTSSFIGPKVNHCSVFYTSKSHIQSSWTLYAAVPRKIILLTLFAIKTANTFDSVMFLFPGESNAASLQDIFF